MNEKYDFINTRSAPRIDRMRRGFFVCVFTLMGEWRRIQKEEEEEERDKIRKER